MHRRTHLIVFRVNDFPLNKAVLAYDRPASVSPYVRDLWKYPTNFHGAISKQERIPDRCSNVQDPLFTWTKRVLSNECQNTNASVDVEDRPSLTLGEP